MSISLFLRKVIALTRLEPLLPEAATAGRDRVLAEYEGMVVVRNEGMSPGEGWDCRDDDMGKSKYGEDK